MGRAETQSESPPRKRRKKKKKTLPPLHWAQWERKRPKRRRPSITHHRWLRRQRCFSTIHFLPRLFFPFSFWRLHICRPSFITPLTTTAPEPAREELRRANEAVWNNQFTQAVDMYAFWCGLGFVLPILPPSLFVACFIQLHQGHCSRSSTHRQPDGGALDKSCHGSCPLAGTRVLYASCLVLLPDRSPH